MQDGDFLVAGETDSFGNEYQVFLLKLDKSGNQIWGRFIGGELAEHGMASCLTYDNTALISGSAWSDSLDRANFYLSELTMDGEITNAWTYDHDWQGGAAAQTYRKYFLISSATS